MPGSWWGRGKFILNFRFSFHNSTDEGGILFHSAWKMTGGRPMFFSKVFIKLRTEMKEALIPSLLQMAVKKDWSWIILGSKITLNYVNTGCWWCIWSNLTLSPAKHVVFNVVFAYLCCSLKCHEVGANANFTVCSTAGSIGGRYFITLYFSFYFAPDIDAGARFCILIALSKGMREATQI